MYGLCLLAVLYLIKIYCFNIYKLVAMDNDDVLTNKMELSLFIISNVWYLCVFFLLIHELSRKVCVALCFIVYFYDESSAHKWISIKRNQSGTKKQNQIYYKLLMQFLKKIIVTQMSARTFKMSPQTYWEAKQSDLFLLIRFVW